MKLKLVTAPLVLSLSLMTHAGDYKTEAKDFFSGKLDSHLELTFYAKAFHIFQTGFNENNKFLGLTYRDYNYGIGVATFKNSYYRQSYMVSFGRYWHPKQDIETFFSLGYVSGYKKHPLVMPYFGVSYTKYRIVPAVSVFGSAVVLSVSYKF